MKNKYERTPSASLPAEIMIIVILVHSNNSAFKKNFTQWFNRMIYSFNIELIRCVRSLEWNEIRIMLCSNAVRTKR